MGTGRLDRAVDAVRNLPGIRHLRRSAYDRLFESGPKAHLFRGVFDSFDAAQAAAPPTRPLGYDNPASADLYLQRLSIDEHDYPSMFWLSQSLQDGLRRVVDLGGAVGIKYFAFGEHMRFPEGLVWRVIDVPAVAARGREFAASRQAGPALEFSDRIEDASGADVLLASGVLQYLPASLPELLDGLAEPPARIVVNTTPIHADRSFFTVNGIGTAFCPYRVQARGAFVSGIEARGYRLRAEWLNVGKAMTIPFEPGYSVPDYSGFCFDRR